MYFYVSAGLNKSWSNPQIVSSYYQPTVDCFANKLFFHMKMLFAYELIVLGFSRHSSAFFILLRLIFSPVSIIHLHYSISCSQIQFYDFIPISLLRFYSLVFIIHLHFPISCTQIQFYEFIPYS